MIGNYYFSPKQMHRLSIGEVVQKVQDEVNVNILESFELENIFGVFCKRKQIPHQGYNPITKQCIDTTRFRTFSYAFNLEGSEEERTSFVMSKTWNEVPWLNDDQTDFPIKLLK